MAQATSGLVDYGATSEEDDFSDFESPERPAEPLLRPWWSLGMSRWLSNDASLWPDCPEQSASQLDQSAQAAHVPSPEGLSVNSSTQEEGGGEGEARQLSDWRHEEQSDQDTDAADSSDSENSELKTLFIVEGLIQTAEVHLRRR